MTDTNVVKWDEEMAKMAKKVAAVERPTVSMISLKSGVMSYLQQPLPGNKLDCIVVAFSFENTYYDTPWTEGVVRPPRCYAQALPPEGDEPVFMTPNEEIEDPIGPEGCEKCSHMQWQDNPRKPGKKQKLCQERRKLALISATEKNFAEAEIALISLPVTSVKNWAQYVNILTATMARPPAGVVTEISVKPDVKTQFQVNFKVVRKVEDEFLGAIFSRKQFAERILMTPYDTEVTTPEAQTEKVLKEGKAAKFTQPKA